MQTSMLAGSLLTIAALVLAGCTGTGNFDVQQTEPFRVSLEGEPQTVVVSEDDSEAKEVVIDTCRDPCASDGNDGDGGDDGCADPCSVNVRVNIQPQDASTCVLKIIIKDADTGEVLEEREVDTGGSSGSSSGPSTVTQTQTQTVTETETSSSTTLVQNFLVNVKGNHNVVVLTQAIEGSADVQVSAAHATGNGEADASNDSTMSPSGSASASASASASNTTTGSPP